jgi:hypothetical protein
MPTLDTELRDLLATVIGKESATTGARVIAETAARAALEALAVALPAPYAHLTDSQRKQRNRLRARARQLGDSLDPKQANPMARLIEQTAYEQWHRMLFARFLAENGLLIHPELGVAVTLEECAEMAGEEFAADGWELAGRYASGMLPQIFRPDDVLLQVALAPEHRAGLEKLLAQLPGALFRASDSLGWCYQFWQARRKKEVNASEVKIGADELPAVTQLFTEPYMVQFLLHNTLGAWWVGAGRALPPGLEMPYLRRLDDGTPAAGTFSGWPRLTRDVKVLDPCCGSGHFLVAAFEILVAFRMAEEGLDARTACDAVLRDNLHGLEIDARCVQIAAFALALAAWTYPGAGGYRPLAPMNVACSGLAISATKAEWEALGGGDARTAGALESMHSLFVSAPTLGSLITLDSARGSLFESGFERVRTTVDRALQHEQPPQTTEAAVTAAGIARAAQLLAATYTLAITNVPYLGRSKQSEAIASYCNSEFPNAHSDLATAMTERCRLFNTAGGTAALVTPQSWMQLGPYKKFRKDILHSSTINLIAQLGAGAFRTISGEIVNVCLVIISKSTPNSSTSVSFLDATLGGVDQKRESLLHLSPLQSSQSTQLQNPDCRILLDPQGSQATLGEYAASFKGIATGDLYRFIQRFWEQTTPHHRWRPLQTSVTDHVFHGGRHSIILWDDGRGELFNFVESRLGSGSSGAWIRGEAAWGRAGVAISQMAGLSTCLYNGDLFDENTAVVIPKDPENLPAIYCYTRSEEFRSRVRLIDSSSLKVPNLTLLKVPFDILVWKDRANLEFPSGLPKVSIQDPSEIGFYGTLRQSTSPLQVAVARLLGYRWPDQQPDALDALADDDGIVCIPAVRGELPAADRLTELLRAAWGADWHPQTLTDLLAAVGHRGTLQEWLRDSFFKQHCKLFHDRPFVWHIWDGHRDGFSALVNYHKLNHDTLKALTYTYLGDWIRTQEAAPSQQSGAAAKLSSARALQQRLAAILEGEAPLDIFVRWKPLEAQPIGWHPDLDDGVRLNIRPFLTVADVGPKGAGVLRVRPGSSLKWGVDRGNNPPGSPWGEKRDNDRHLTLAEKRKARGM